MASLVAVPLPHRRGPWIDESGNRLELFGRRTVEGWDVVDLNDCRDLKTGAIQSWAMDIIKQEQLATASNEGQ